MRSEKGDCSKSQKGLPDPPSTKGRRAGNVKIVKKERPDPSSTLTILGFWVAYPAPFSPLVSVLLFSVSDPFPYPSCLCLPLRTPFPLSLTVSPRGRLLRRQFGIVVNMRLAGNRRPEFYEGFSVSCLAQASATLLSALSSPGMIAQLCFSI